ncbi:Protein FAR1-RELATED SEQUENCE 5 [Rhynchospora pubera]|uniref:Protein FAR1-RELATED SEQUENCE 5 n=1 Tax=Rhynchospora pubera TaxID=906938 RepID=A0AAV8CNJ4_9POAL|nr:Protein FAR1-RELATED SEQUENCE 5 [Rhynchospora pubera]
MAIEDPDPHETQTSSEESSMDDTDPHADLALCPFVGKEFMTEDDAKDFYNRYAYIMGFSIRKATFYKSVKSDEVTSLRFVCSMEGLSKKCKEAQNENAPTKSPQKDRPANRNGCKASLRIRFVNGIWKVSVFNDVHNHPLVTSPFKKRSLRSHKSLDSDDREIIKDMTAQNIEATKIHECLAVKHGGKKFLRFKRKDISNEIAYQKQKILGHVSNEISTLFKIEKEASKFYTCAVMSVFKQILKKTQLGFVKEIDKDFLYEVTIKYNPMVAKMVPETYMVNINILKELVSCSFFGRKREVFAITSFL